MRSRAFFLTALAVASTFALPVLAHATVIPYFGPIVPSLNATCAGAWSGLVQMLNNIIAFLITIAITAIAPIMIAYAGFLYVVNPVNPSGRSKANEVLKTTIIGIVIALSAWLIVDAILSALTSQGVASWTAIMFSNGTGPCLSIQTDTFNQASTPSTTGTIAQTPLSSSGSGACDPSVVSQGTSGSGYPMSNAEANTLACIAGAESTCGTNTSNYNWGNGSSAAGAFQVLLQTNSTCYDNPVCETAAGQSGTPLNCASAFSGGNPKTDSVSQALLNKCLAAAGNVNCSASSAACMVAQKCPGGATSASCYSDWTSNGDPSHAKQQQCVSQYNNG